VQPEQMETSSSDEHFGKGQAAYEYMKLLRSYILHLHSEFMQSPGKGVKRSLCLTTGNFTRESWALLAYIKAPFGLVTPAAGVSHNNTIHIVKSYPGSCIKQHYFILNLIPRYW